MGANRYSAEFKEQALRQVYNRKDRTIAMVAADLNTKANTLKNWVWVQRFQPRLRETAALGVPQNARRVLTRGHGRRHQGH